MRPLFLCHYAMGLAGDSVHPKTNKATSAMRVS